MEKNIVSLFEINVIKNILPITATTMKLFSLLVYYKGEPSPHMLKAAHDLSSFSFFQRSSVQEFMTFTAKILTERTNIGDRQSVTEGEYMCHVFVRSDGLTGVCLSDHEYPPRVAHTLVTKVMEDFSLTVKLLLHKCVHS
jgi:synaptobrevin family protein YKT6